MVGYFFAVLVGFLLPWQTRFLLRVPLIGGVPWDFGIVSLYVSQCVLFVWIILELWAYKKFWVYTNRRVWVAAYLFIAIQFICTADIFLTLQVLWCIGLLVGLFLILKSKPNVLKPFFGAVLLSVILQALIGFMQVMAGASFPSSLLGIALHRASQLGSAIVESSGQRFLRAYGGQPHPNIFGGLLLAACVVYVRSVLHTVGQIAVRKNIIQCTLLLVVTLFISFSRTAWGGFLILMFILWTEKNNASEGQRIFMRWAIGIFFACTIIFAPFVFGRVVPETRIEKQSLSMRVSELDTWRTVMRAHWLFGTGIGSYTKYVGGEQGYARVPVHNALLLMCAEIGLSGLMLFAWIVWVLREKIHLDYLYLVFVPMVFFDHYVWSLWAGMIVVFLILTATVMHDKMQISKK